MTKYGTYVGDLFDPIVLGDPVRSVYADLQVNLTAPMIENMNLGIAQTRSVATGLQPCIRAVWSRTATMTAHIQGSPENQLDLDLVIQGASSISAGMDAIIDAIGQRTVGLDLAIVDILPYRYLRLRRDLMTRYFGGFSSDANFFEGFDPPNPSAIINNDIGVFNYGSRRLSYQTTNEIPSPGAFDKYSLPLSAPLAVSAIGFRAIVNFRILQIGPNSVLMFGLFGDQLDPLASIASGNVCAFSIEPETDHMWFRGWFGTSAAPQNVGLAWPVSYFCNRDFVLEMELVNLGIVYVMEYRLYDRDRDLDHPIISFQVDTSFVPVVDRFSITSLGRRSAGLPTAQPLMVAEFEYVDIERGLGSLYAVNPATGITSVDAKWRPYQDRPPVQLRQFGHNEILGALSTDGIGMTMEASDTIEASDERPIIHVSKFTPESPALVPYAVTPPIPKGSLQPGFSKVEVRWFSTQAGVWSLRANSTSQIDGIEIRSGVYNTPGIDYVLVWDFAELPPIDGIYDVTLYVTNAAGLTTGKGLGEYLLPFRPVLGAALDVSIAPRFYMIADMNAFIAMYYERSAFMNMNIEIPHLIAGLGVNITALPDLKNSSFDTWTSPNQPDFWSVWFASPGLREVSQVGSGQGHGGVGTGAANIYNNGSANLFMEQPCQWFEYGAAYTVTIIISYASGVLYVAEGSSQFSYQTYTTTGTKVIHFTATSFAGHWTDIIFQSLGYSNFTIDSVTITKDP